MSTAKAGQADMKGSATGRAPEKPTYGSPCNGCGYCCAAVPCQIAYEMLGATEGPCPAMEFDDDRFWCGLARNASRYLDTPVFADAFIGHQIARMLGFGKGCDSDDCEEAA